jgi:hypothetical protein
LRVPARNALLADVVPAAVYGCAYGFERAMDNLGAIGGPLVAVGLVGLIGVRSAILLSIIPGLLAALAIVYALRRTPAPTVREHQPIRLRVRPLLHGRLGQLLAASAAFELGNLAATLLILRATELLQPGRSHTSAAQLALVLYTAYNLAAAREHPSRPRRRPPRPPAYPRRRSHLLPDRLPQPRVHRGELRATGRLLHPRQHRSAAPKPPRPPPSHKSRPSSYEAPPSGS